MTQQKGKNVAASVKQRLLNRAQENKEDFQFVLIRYGIERFLYRLSQSEYADLFVLKGAMLFHLFADEAHRATRDVDLLGRGEADVDRIKDIFTELCILEVEDDGLVFDETTIQVGQIREDAKYQGIRIQIAGLLARARISLQIDIGFGDAVTPNPRKKTLPCILDFPAPQLSIYPWETVVAEKYQALVELGMTNSRMKDFFDLQHLAREFEFDGVKLSKAIKATFNRRNTELPESVPTGLTKEFATDATIEIRWSTFLRRSLIEDISLQKTTDYIWSFLEPITTAIRYGNAFEKTWHPGGPW